MQRIAVILALVGGPLVSLTGCVTNDAPALEGTWELVEAKYSPPDPTSKSAEWRQIKIITKTHWAFLSQKREPPKVTGLTNDSELLAAAKAFGAGGGTYTLDGDTYTERIQFFNTPNYVGIAVPFKIKWEGDEWIQTGTFPVKSLGLGGSDMELYERYRRVK
jgi:hypothetical protein